MTRKRAGRQARRLRTRTMGIETLEPRLAFAAVPVGPSTDVSVQAPLAGRSQGDADVAFSSDGRYVVSWTERDSSGVGSVHLQAFTANDQRLGDEIVIASFFGSSIENASIALSGDGNTLVVAYEWQETPNVPADRNIYVKLFTLGESFPLTTNFVNSTSAGAGNFDPDVAVANDGSFIVVWESRTYQETDDFGSQVRFRRFDSAGEAIGNDEWVFNTGLLDSRQQKPSVDLSPNGRAMVVAWEEQRDDVEWVFFDTQGTNALVTDTSKWHGAIVGSNEKPNRSPVVVTENEQEFVLAFMDHRSVDVLAEYRDSLEVIRYKDGLPKEDCPRACAPNELGFEPSGLQFTNNAFAVDQGVSLGRPALDVVPDGTGSLVYTWNGVYRNLWEETEFGNDIYFKEYTNRSNGIAEIFTAGQASGSVSGQSRWGRVSQDQLGHQVDPAVSSNHSGFVVAYTDQTRGRIQVRRYQTPIDLVASQMQVGRSANDASRDFRSGEQILVEFATENLVQAITTQSGYRLERTGRPNDFDVSIVLSSSATDAQGTLLGKRRLKAQEVLSKTVLQELVYLPVAGASIYQGDGTYYVHLVIDSEAEVFETNEQNNSVRGAGIDVTAIQVTRTIPVAPQFVYSTLVDSSTLAPGANLPFTHFFPPVAASDKVVFVAVTERGEGLYQFAGGELTVLADNTTPVPGGTGTIGGFTFFGNDVISTDGTSTAFFASDRNLNKGIYLHRNGTNTLVANEQTPFPGGDGTELISFPANPSVQGDTVVFTAYDGQNRLHLLRSKGGVLDVLVGPNTPIPGLRGGFDAFTSATVQGNAVVFHASSTVGNQEGIYLWTPSGIRVIADLDTIIPGRSQKFQSFARPGRLTMEGDQIVFIADGQQGIYRFDGRTLNRVADTSTPIPNGTGNFTSFNAVSLRAGVIAFDGQGAGTQGGIYAFLKNEIVPVLLNGDTLTGKTLFYPEISGEGIGSTGIGLAANFVDGSRALIVGRQRNPTAKLQEVQAVGSVMRVTYTISDGPLPSQDLVMYRSAVAGFTPQASEIDRLQITDPNLLTSGTHVIEIPLGGDPGQIALPGAGTSRSEDNYFIVAQMGSSSTALRGVYHLAGGPVMVHGDANANEVTVRHGSVEIEIDGQVFRFESATVTHVEVRTHGGNDWLDTLAADVTIQAWLGVGTDTVEAGPTTTAVDGGSGNDQYRLGHARQIIVNDPQGTDLLDFSASLIGITINLDSTVQQSLHSTLVVTITGLFENLIATPFSDQIQMQALAQVNRSLDFPANFGTSRDQLQIDGQGSTTSANASGLRFAESDQLTITGSPVLLFSNLYGWSNPTLPMDVDSNGRIEPLDALLVINELNRRRFSDDASAILDTSHLPTSYFYDVDGNQKATPIDALLVINHLNRQGSAEREPEQDAMAGWLVLDEIQRKRKL